MADSSAGKVYQPALRRYRNVSVGRVGHARGYSIGGRGKRANVWSPYAIRDGIDLGRAVTCRDIATGSHRLGCEYGCRDQSNRHECQFSHWFSPQVTEAKEARLHSV